MTIQTEQALENNLIARLTSNGYERVTIKDKDELLANFKQQIELHNKKRLIETGEETLSDEEFKRIIIHLEGGSTFQKAKKLRDKYELDRDGSTVYIEFINQKEWCKNRFQVTNQVTDKGRYTTRYDVTILINGLPLVQIELKRRGLELKEAFKQIKRYHKHSFTGLFSYIQIFVVSNGVNTKYFANNSQQNFKQTFFWTDTDNNRCSHLDSFTDAFFEKCHLAKMITRYIVLHESDKVLMILRPYQYFAVESIIKRVEESPHNGYIWHTTGSGKTLTSFKAAQLLTQKEKVDKILFVVDRKDLDYQTTVEFNAFSEGSVDGTDNTASLVKQLASSKKLVITTIQKLTKAIKTNRYEEKMAMVKDKSVVFIFDECHRSQFGDMHKDIMAFFTNHQSFGFTGTPIFADNANNRRTTKDLFHSSLHKYLIKDAIADDNVLGFSVDYQSTFKASENSHSDSVVEGIDCKEVMESDKRVEKVTDHILTNYNRKTFNREFTSLLVAPNIPTLCKYYDTFKRKEHPLKIATIFSFTPNEEEWDERESGTTPQHSRDKLESYMRDYNTHFGSDYSTDTFDAYYVNVAKRVRNREIDLLIVVNMFLTGFDSKSLNTLFVDKNMVFHNLIQAFSRTNRIYTEKKRHGNIVCYRNLKERTDEAIRLYSDKDANETLDTVLMKSYDEYLDIFNKRLKTLYKIAPDLQAVDELQSETEKEGFVVAFRALLRLKTRLSTFEEFSFEDTKIGEQDFEDYTSKYRDLYDTVKSSSEPDKISILDDIDFEIELLKRDDINVDYILELLKQLNFKAKSFKKEKEFIIENLSKSVELKSKKELIEKFINENIPHIRESKSVEEEFEKFIAFERKREFDTLVTKEQLNKERVATAIDDFEFTGKLRKPLLKESITQKLGFKEKRTKLKELEAKVMNFIDKFAF